MQIISPKTEKDFLEMVQIYNRAYAPFLEIYSKEEMEAFGDDLEETIESLKETAETREVLCLKENDEIVGYVVFRKKNKTVVWISSLYVDPKSQRAGYGKKLLEEVESFAKNNNCGLVALETHAKATWAIDFYKKRGYEIVNEKMEEFPYGEILEKPPVPGRPVFAKVL